jgi:hypothetical protein
MAVLKISHSWRSLSKRIVTAPRLNLGGRRWTQVDATPAVFKPFAGLGGPEVTGLASRVSA